jgi:hypothetical protein
MALPHGDIKSAGPHLAVRDGILESPGSSVFHLPTQNLAQTKAESKPINAIAGLNINEPNNKSERDAAPSFLVISGGSGGNAICSAFNNACYVLPVSDDGGSSSEIIRVLGGPSIGDLEYAHLTTMELRCENRGHSFEADKINPSGPCYIPYGCYSRFIGPPSLDKMY